MNENSIIDNCERLPLQDFIRCSVDRNLDVLNAKSDEEAREAWDKIKEQYAKLSGGLENYGVIADALGNILKLSSKIYCFETLSDLIKIYNFEILHLKIDEITGQKGSVIDDGDGNFIISKKGIAIYKSWKLSIDQYSAILSNELKNSNATQEAIGRGYFQDTLLSLSKEMGFAIQEKDITTYQFAKMVGEFRKKAIQLRLKSK